MTRNMIFGGAIAGVIAVVAISGFFSDNRSSEASWSFSHEVSGDELVIESDSRRTVVRTSKGDVDCDKNDGSVTITRANGQEITITCD
ncbi:hypothetical protein [Kordiimonas aestuarii]|uniref:hypothetical protein n=1 Tax=Kordiimonas aestuarii TaxID=1005925 RepID=UPI0021CFA482|nr:hypothetical protein [Kordiimonas aestuarii]